MNIKSLTCVAVLGIAMGLTSCQTDKVGDYPLPSRMGNFSNTLPMPTQTNTAGSIQDTSTLGDGINTGDTTTNTPPTDNVPSIPGEPNIATNNLTGASSTTSSKNYPYAIPIPGDIYHVLSPYDRKRVNIKQASGRPIPSGKLIRAVGETDPNKKFYIP